MNSHSILGSERSRLLGSALLLLALSLTANARVPGHEAPEGNRPPVAGHETTAGCDLALALGSPLVRTLPADPVPTDINIMPTRYWDLVYALAGSRQTGVPLVAIIGGVFGPAGGPDDVGSYYLIPEFSMLLGLPVARGVYLFYNIVLSLTFLAGAVGFLVLYDKPLARAVALAGLLLLTVVAYKIGDVYVFHFVTAAVATPWILVLIRPANQGFWLYVFLAMMGILVGTANAVRSHSGTAALIFLCLILFLQLSASRRRKLVLVLCLMAGLLIPRLFFAHAVARRDAFLDSRCPEYQTLSAQHPLWHALYAALGYLGNDYGLRWDDSTSYGKVQSIAPGTVYGSAKYEGILRREVLHLVWRHPGFVCLTLASKLGVILTFIVLFANMGLLAAVMYRKPWPIEIAFSGAIGFNALFGLLVMPYPRYLLGLIAFAGLYSITSLDFLIQSGTRPRGERRSRLLRCAA